LYQGGKEAYQEGQNIKTTADIIPALTRTYVSGQEHLLKAVPGGEQLWNFGQDVHEGNWAGAAGGATSAFLQAALGDALFGERPNAPKVTTTATPSVPSPIPAEETVRTLHPAVETPGPEAVRTIERNAASETHESLSIEALTARAKEIHDALHDFAKIKRTTAALGTREGKVIIGGGGRDLDPAQCKLLKPEEIEARLGGADAEITVLKKAFELELRPKALSTTWNICPRCQAFIEATGGKLTSKRSAVWPD
jgi:hypothetical protein